MTSIEAIRAIELLDSRGNPTVGATVRLSSGFEASAAVPSGREYRPTRSGGTARRWRALYGQGCE